jgi:hypothetical protein
MAKPLEPCLPTNNPRVLQMLMQAAKTNAARDKVDESNGGTALCLLPLSLQLRTAMSAIACGMGRGTWEEVAEGLAMLVQAEVPLRQLEGEIQITLKTRK